MRFEPFFVGRQDSCSHTGSEYVDVALLDFHSYKTVESLDQIVRGKEI